MLKNRSCEYVHIEWLRNSSSGNDPRITSPTWTRHSLVFPLSNQSAEMLERFQKFWVGHCRDASPLRVLFLERNRLRIESHRADAVKRNGFGFFFPSFCVPLDFQCAVCLCWVVSISERVTDTPSLCSSHSGWPLTLSRPCLETLCLLASRVKGRGRAGSTGRVSILFLLLCQREERCRKRLNKSARRPHGTRVIKAEGDLWPRS